MVAEGQFDASGSCAKLQAQCKVRRLMEQMTPQRFLQRFNLNAVACSRLTTHPSTHVARPNQPELHESCIMATHSRSIACDVSRLTSGAQVWHFQHFSPTLSPDIFFAAGVK